MFIYPEVITSPDIFINSNYLNTTTIARIQENKISFSITKGDSDNTIELDYAIILESIHNCETIIKASLKIVTKFMVTKFKDDDLITLDTFLKDIFSKIENYLQENIPIGIISLPTSLKQEADIEKLKEAVFFELIKQDFY